ncbi:Lem3/Cdc50 [Neocallimastix lanati (nom. inval.)]|jgi:disulfide bond formation protein DsbB|uniref:Lem3/Cdc50 n=1 Tax=Neocallimastix californiae TaxID=1754190 RepID=A0A1Y2FE47_9FUNG|nr:Lem3/Cdc50 [Neocallimastix sp. JGI-2020a]ORY82189.1 Lem3/Cdc50 [Neocallimastix californiae]|eukprot:ORY82189.1 Lem3/Cdc50 [Neocallimastix californiae]
MADNQPKVNKPKNNAIRQQRLKAWQPILTPKNVLPTLFFIGIAFIPIGIGLFIAATKVNEFQFEYTNCKKAPAQFTATEHDKNVQWKYVNETNTCTVKFEIKETFKKPVFFYYRLTSFYQNHRSYVKSYDSTQLEGKKKPDSLNSNCDPVRFEEKTKYQYFPCGLIANSMFTDVFANELVNGNNTKYELKDKGIAWPSDADKYGSKDDFLKLYGDDLSKIRPPPHWQTGFPEFANGYTKENFPDLKNWEHFQVWMRTAGLPNFRKLYSKNEDADLKPGVYTLDITNRYDVDRYGGTKSFVITTTSIIGGKNPFLGIAYVFVGFISLVFGIIFLIRHLYKPRKLGDHKYLSWNKASAAATNADAGDR